MPGVPGSSESIEEAETTITRNGGCGRKRVRARTTHYNLPSLSLRCNPWKRLQLRQEPKKGLSTLVGRQTVGTGEGDVSPARPRKLKLT